MTNYKRIVSYMYSYHNKVKANNTGYARIETRGDQSRITIHTRLLENYAKTIDIYLYIWEKGQMYCLLLGSAPINNYCLDFKINVNTYNVLGSDFRLEDMNGILAYMNDSEYIGTEWDDAPVHFSSFHTIKNRSDIAKIESSITRVQVPSYSMEKEENETVKVAELEQSELDSESEAQQSLAESVNEKESEEQVESDHIEEVIASTEVISSTEVIASTEEIQNQSQQEQQEELKDEQVSEQPDMEEQEKIQTTEVRETVTERTLLEENKEQLSEIKATEFLTCFKPCESYDEYEEISREISRLQKQIMQLEQIQETYRNNHNITEEFAQKQKKELENRLLESMELVEDPEKHKEEAKKRGEWKKEQQSGSLAQRIFNKFPKVLPDVEESIEECVKIGPQDIGMFPMENWILANNSFLLHGYYNYHHMILAKIKEDNHFKYLLGIPGVNNSREAFVARMFGFGQFMPLRKQEGVEDNFGYWCMEIKLKE